MFNTIKQNSKLTLTFKIVIFKQKLMDTTIIRFNDIYGSIVSNRYSRKIYK